MLLSGQVRGVLIRRPMNHVPGHILSIGPNIVFCADIADLRGSLRLPIPLRHR
jgi:hypothetical protein